MARHTAKPTCETELGVLMLSDNVETLRGSAKGSVSATEVLNGVGGPLYAERE